MFNKQKLAAMLAEKAAGRADPNNQRPPTMNPQIHSPSSAPKMPSMPLPKQTNYMPTPKEPGINKPLRFAAIKQKLGKF